MAVSGRDRGGIAERSRAACLTSGVAALAAYELVGAREPHYALAALSAMVLTLVGVSAVQRLLREAR